MKLLKAEGCCLPPAGGNVKQTAMIVEVQWMVFWTRVRFPPAPLFSDYRSQNFCFCVISVRVQLVKIFQSFRTFLKIWPRPLSRPNRLTSYIYRYLSTSVLSGSYLVKLRRIFFWECCFTNVGVAVATLRLVEQCYQENRQGGLPEYKPDSTLGKIAITYTTKNMRWTSASTMRMFFCGIPPPFW